MVPSAGLGSRFSAYLVDQFLLGLAIGLPLNYFSTSSVVAATLTQLFGLAYWTIMDSVYGQSLGKQLLHIKTVSTEGRMTWPAAFIRSIPKAATGLLILDILPLLTKHDQRFTDRLVKTRVIQWTN